MPRKFTWEEVNQWFIERKSQLLTDHYEECKQRLKYVCGECGKIHERMYSEVRKEGICGPRLAGEPSKFGKRSTSITEEVLKQRFAKKGKRFIQELEPYDRGDRLIRVFQYQCSCGNVTTTFHTKNLGDGCEACYQAKKRKNFDEVRETFHKQHQELLSSESDYINNSSKLECHCLVCDWTCYTTYASVRSGSHPCLCAIEKKSQKVSGENNGMYGRYGSLNPNWNPDKTDDDRIKKRMYEAYTKFRNATFERDDYTCQVCGARGGKLHAHHLFPYAEYDDLRLDLQNSVTLCFHCHDVSSPVGFHHIWGTKNITPYQFWAYVKWRQEQIDNVQFEEVDRNLLNAI